MAIFKREFIAVPDDRKDQLVYKWPDKEIRRFTRAIIAPDETAVFIRQGQVMGTLQPGRYTLDATELPFLGAFADTASGGNMYRTELYFVSSRDVLDKFGGQIDEVQDPQTGLLVTLRVFGEYVVKVVDGATLIVKYAGTEDNPTNDKILSLSEELLLRGLRTDLTQNIVRNGWPVLGLAAYTDEMEKAAVEAGNRNLADYGLQVVRMTNFTVTLDEQTEEELRRLAKDTAYSRLAGSFQQYAAGEAALGAGEGMSRGGGTGGALFAAGVGIGGQVPQQYPTGPQPAPPPAQGGPGYAQQQPGGGPPPVGSAPAAVACPSCGTSNPAGARFCTSCGTSLAPQQVTCASCGSANPPSAKFCASCGKPLGGSQPVADQQPAPGGDQPPPSE